LKHANVSISKTRTEGENQVVAALDAIKSQFRKLDELTAMNTALRERMVEEEQRLESSKEKIAKLEEDLLNKSNAESGFRQRIDELQSSNASLESEKASAEAGKAKLLELTTSESNLKQELEKLKNEKIESLATITSMAEQSSALEREKGDLQVSCWRRANVNYSNSRSGPDQRNYQNARECATCSPRLWPRKSQD